MFHPGQRLVCGALFDPWYQQESSAVGGGFEDVLTGELVAEFTLFREPGSWLITTREGSVNGAGASLSRVTWRQPGTINVIRDPAHTLRVVHPQRVAATVSQSLQGLREQLQQMPVPEIAPPQAKELLRNPWFKNFSELEAEAVRIFRDAGADLEINTHNRVTSLRSTEPVTVELLKQLRWTNALDQLDLAATGIRDEDLDQIGLLPSLKRLSLQGNPITDRGVIQLAASWNLEVLDLHDTQVTATGLNALRMLAVLKTLIVPESIRIEDLTAFLKQRPQLAVIRKSGRE